MVLVNMADTAAEQAARVVLTAAKADVAPVSAELTTKIEPGLKPYHPNQRQKVPSI